MKKVMILLILIVSNNAFALGQVNNFEVAQVRVDKSGKGYVKFTSPIASSPPSCSTHTYHLAFDTNTDGGKAILSIVLAAKAANKQIWARGNGKCDIYGVVESWDWGYIL